MCPCMEKYQHKMKWNVAKLPLRYVAIEKLHQWPSPCETTNNKYNRVALIYIYMHADPRTLQIQILMCKNLKWYTKFEHEYIYICMLCACSVSFSWFSHRWRNEYFQSYGHIHRKKTEWLKNDSNQKKGSTNDRRKKTKTHKKI